MNIKQVRVPDAARSHLRSVVEAVDYEISLLKQIGIDEPYVATDRLRDNWKELMTLLALGPEPEYRECTSCHNVGMRLATICGFCWNKLPPINSPPEATGKKSESIS